MSQIACCPACKTTFKVVADQLRISDGWVRCGACNEIFHAITHMCDARRDSGPELPQKAPNAPSQSPTVARPVEPPSFTRSPPMVSASAATPQEDAKKVEVAQKIKLPDFLLPEKKLDIGTLALGGLHPLLQEETQKAAAPSSAQDDAPRQSPFPGPATADAPHRHAAQENAAPAPADTASHDTGHATLEVSPLVAALPDGHMPQIDQLRAEIGTVQASASIHKAVQMLQKEIQQSVREAAKASPSDIGKKHQSVAEAVAALQREIQQSKNAAAPLPQPEIAPQETAPSPTLQQETDDPPVIALDSEDAAALWGYGFEGTTPLFRNSSDGQTTASLHGKDESVAEPTGKDVAETLDDADFAPLADDLVTPLVLPPEANETQAHILETPPAPPMENERAESPSRSDMDAAHHRPIVEKTSVADAQQEGSPPHFPEKPEELEDIHRARIKAKQGQSKARARAAGRSRGGQRKLETSAPAGKKKHTAPAPQEPCADAPMDEAADERSENAVDEASFMRQARRREYWMRPHVRIGVAVSAVMLGCILAWQVLVFNRDALMARQPQFGDMLKSLCAPLGCVPGPLYKIESIAVDAAAFDMIPNASSEFRLMLAIKNKDALAVAAPAIELTLRDSNEDLLVRRVLTQQDLGAPQTIAPRETWYGTSTMRVHLPDDAAIVSGFHVRAFYP